MKKLDNIQKQLDAKIISIMLDILKPVEDKQRANIKQYWNNLINIFLESRHATVYQFLEHQYGIENHAEKWNALRSRIMAGDEEAKAERKQLDNNYRVKMKEMTKDPLMNLHNLCYTRTDNETNIANRDLRLQNFIDKDTEFAILNGRYKLFNTIIKHFSGVEIKDIKTIYVNYSEQGLEGKFELTLSDDTTKVLVTQAIYAGGYNIQKLHLRYLSKVS